MLKPIKHKPMNIQEAIELAEAILSQHSVLCDWTVVSNRRKKAFGVCSYRKKEIQLSSIVVPYMTNEAIKDTILHEIAHALCPRQYHNHVWRAKCIELGGNGERCGDDTNYSDGNEGRLNMLEKVSKYSLSCPTCGIVSYKQRMSKRSFSCANHGGGYDPKYKLVVALNV